MAFFFIYFIAVTCSRLGRKVHAPYVPGIFHLIPAKGDVRNFWFLLYSTKVFNAFNKIFDNFSEKFVLIPAEKFENS